MIKWSDMSSTSRGGHAYVYDHCHAYHGKIVTGMTTASDAVTSHYLSTLLHWLEPCGSAS
jgi:hypothetical protein